MDALIVQFIGVFAKVQDLVDAIVQHHAKQAMPKLGPVISRRFLNRVNDNDRLTMLHAVASEGAYSGDLSKFDEVYSRVRVMRNRLTHGGAVPSRNGTEYIIGLTPTERARGVAASPNLSPEDADQILAEANWLLTHIAVLGVESGAFSTSIVVSDGKTEPYRYPTPPAEPPRQTQRTQEQ